MPQTCVRHNTLHSSRLCENRWSSDT